MLKHIVNNLNDGAYYVSINFNVCYNNNLFHIYIFTFMHLADAFIQSNLQCIQAIHALSVHVFPGNWTHNLCTANTMLYHWATGTHIYIYIYISFLLIRERGRGVWKLRVNVHLHLRISLYKQWGLVTSKTAISTLQINITLRLVSQ